MLIIDRAADARFARFKTIDVPVVPGQLNSFELGLGIRLPDHSRYTKNDIILSKCAY